MFVPEPVISLAVEPKNKVRSISTEHIVSFLFDDHYVY